MSSNKKNKRNKNRMYLPEAKKILNKPKDELCLNVSEYIFTACYISNGLNKEDAYIKAGYKTGSRKSLEAQASSILNRPHVNKAIKDYIDTSILPYKDKLEFMILNVCYNRAFYQIDWFFDPDGKPIELDELDDSAKFCIDGIQKKTLGSGNNQRIVTQYKLADRHTSITFLMQLLDKYNEKGESSMNALSNEQKKKVQDIFKKAANGEFSTGLFKKYNLENDKHASKIIDVGKVQVKK